ncbi:hypothetical protein Bca52824_015417 [Brassica carinata]|uniref:Uncharacterized protein n=1 Tax=Brassica carinata TaxID=52824 RepID=A0A8X7W337_BRACI|nr:hypothetical protein Bca52824_015417 [Brassica carinata]
MSRPLFLRIVDAVENHDNYFKQRRDIIGRLGLSYLQKTTAVFRMLAYGLPADATDEYIKIGESTAIESMKRFCRAVVEIFSEESMSERCGTCFWSPPVTLCNCERASSVLEKRSDT